MDDVFEKAHEFVQRWEGGYCDDAGDPGGATKYGVSLRFLRSEGYDIDGDGDVDVDDVKAVTKAKARELFRKHFWPATLSAWRLRIPGLPRRPMTPR